MITMREIERKPPKVQALCRNLDSRERLPSIHRHLCSLPRVLRDAYLPGYPMKKITSSFALAALTLGFFASPAWASLTAGMKEGKPEIKAMNQLTFGPEGVLFIAD